MKTLTCIILLFVFAVLPCAGCAQETSRSETFEEVWNTVNDNYFDPSFGGVQWEDVGKRYRDLVIAAQTDSIFYVRLNEMLFTLGVSHIAVIPKKHPEWIGAPSLFSDGGIGAETRIVEGKMVFTMVRRGSVAEGAGLRTGYVLQRLDGMTVADLEDEALAEPRPPLDDRVLITQKVLERLYGKAGQSIDMEVIDEKGATHKKTVVRTLRPGRTIFMEGLPPTFVEFESRRVEGDIAYIRFNSFHPALVDQILNAIDDAQGSRGLIIDLRGNAGGAFGVRRAIAERLVPKRTLFWRYKRRDRTDEVYLEPADRVYNRSVAILTDCLSSSSSEEFAGSMQAIGRAVVIGEKTPGVVLVAEVVELRSGDTLVYPSAQTITPDGRILEGNGVVPDIEADLTVETLLDGRDLHLEAAIAYIRTKTYE